MAFHLEGPWLSTTGKKRGPKKWASAEAKRKAQLLDEQWKAKLKAWGLEAEDKKRKRALVAPPMPASYGPKIPPGRETERIASRDTGMIPCTKKADTVYTGTKIKGIGTMHKSNAVPVFSDQEAVDISTMRR
jgi:hypothetical protein